MTSLLVAFISSFIATLLIIRFEYVHGHISGDNDLDGPQKFHEASVPRIGGIGIAIGVSLGILIRFLFYPSPTIGITLLACAMPVFAIGLLEDLTKKIGVKVRLLAVGILAGFASYYLGVQITRFDVVGIDSLLLIPGVAFVFTIFAVTGLANAYNIIDGFNGLSSMVAVITLMGLSYVSYQMQDPLLIYLSLLMAAAILGFFLWNYPKGLIFLGDGGAYLIGFWVAIISILLVTRHANVSPWFALLINAYPILETVFTMYRRKIHQGKSPSAPDGIHFHTLIYRRILAPTYSANSSFITANSKTAPYLWLLTTLAVVPAILMWDSTPLLIMSIFLFIVTYVWLYTKIVRFKTPRWMHPFKKNRPIKT
jgi:UDP-N-acetylmuramyl pentapeptide phosphotransferase/UDP-N-acetylglucosamine-1-phosphate transferase